MGAARSKRPAGHHVASRKMPGPRRVGALLVVVACCVGAVAAGVTLGGQGGSGPHDGGPAAGSGTGVDPASVGHLADRSLSTSTTGGRAIDAPGFARGACVVFRPSGRSNGRTVFLDAGHGGIDPGGQGVTKAGQVIYEAPLNLTIELETMNLLRDDGFAVVVSRVRNGLVMRPTARDYLQGALSAHGAVEDVAARDACANRAKATVLVGIYMDAGASPTDAGCLTAYDASRSFSQDSRRLARLVQHDVLDRMNAYGWKIPDDGVQDDATLGGVALTTSAASYPHLLLLGPGVPGWFTTPSRMPGALVEPLFISDPFEGSVATSAKGQGAIARGVAEAVAQYFATSA